MKLKRISFSLEELDPSLFDESPDFRQNESSFLLSSFFLGNKNLDFSAYDDPLVYLEILVLSTKMKY